MHNSLKKVSLWHILWFLVYLVPFINWIIYAIVNNGQNFESLVAFDRTNIGFQYAIDKNNIFFTWFVDIYKLISQNSDFVLASNFETILLIMCYWVVMVSFFRIIVDLALFIPRICHNMIHKLSRERGNEL